MSSTDNNRIVMVSNYSMHNKCVYDLTICNHHAYCVKFGIDLLSTVSEYTPYNNIDEIEMLFTRYSTVIPVGTDILFTDMNKDIRDFIDPEYPLIAQIEINDGINGDFLIFNRTPESERLLTKLRENRSWSSQGHIDELVGKGEKIKKLPIRTIQSVCPFMNEGREHVQKALWQPGDFSVHAMRPGWLGDINSKVNMLNNFLDHYGSYTEY